MYKLLIIDDEPIIVQRLLLSIDWSKLGIAKLYSAYSGAEAMKIIQDMKPDLIVSDVCMPGLSGIYLAKHIYEAGLNTQVVLISGYSDFHYVKQALDFGCVGYITKPIDADELIAAVQKGVRTIQRKRQLRLSLPCAQERFWVNAINGYYPDPCSFQQESQQVSLYYDPAWSYFCICIRICFEGSVDDYKKSLLTNATVFDFTNFFSDTGKDSFFFSPGIGQIVGFVFYDSGNSPTDSTNRHMKEIVAAIEGFDGCTAACGKSGNCSDWGAIPTAYHAARHLAEAAIQPLAQSEARLRYSPSQSIDQGWIASLCCGILTKDLQRIQTVIQNYLVQVPQNYEAIGFRSLGFEIANYISETLVNEGHLRNISASEFSYTLLTHLHDVVDRESLGIFLERISQVLVSDVSMDNESHTNHVIQQILEYVEEHYAEPISSKSVAEHFFFNPSYFSRLFKSEMDIRFTPYLTNFRIEKAEELMRTCNMRTADIAMAVGFTDERYFYKTYKALRGITPRQFRESGKCGSP